MNDNQQIPTSKISAVTQKDIRNYFLLYLILGIISILVPAYLKTTSVPIAVILPVIVMFTYMFTVYRKARGVLASDQIGDSVYYLGFLLTLFALILTLFYYRDAQDPLENILPKFGIALITTIVGLGVRVYITAFDVSAEDTQDIADTNLTDASIQLKTQLNVANETFKHSVNTLSEELRMTLESHSNQLSIFLKKNNEEFANSSEKIVSKINEASSALSNQSGKLESSLTNLNSSIDSFQSSITSINQEVSNIGKSFQDLSKVNITEQLTNLNDQMTLFGSTLRDHNTKMSDIKDIVEKDVTFLKDQRNQLYSSIEQSQKSVEHIQKNLVSLTKVVVDKLKD